MHLRFRHVVRNVFSNWFATAANMAVGFFLSPFIVHRLGNAEYGIWVLAISSVNYLGLLDLGMRSAVLRFVSKHHTQQDHAGAGEALSAALWVRLQISLLVLVLSGLLAFFFPALFKVQPELVTTARLAVMIIGFSTALGMSVGVFGGVLSALNRYDLQSRVTLVQMAVRATGVIWVLRTGHGIVAIALCEMLAASLGNGLLYVLSRRVYPEMKVRLARPESTILRSLWSYSFYAFLTTIAVQLIYQTDNLVVGTFVSTSAVTFYAIGNSLCRYTDQFAGSMTLTFVPAASNFEAAGDIVRLQGLYRFGTQAMMAVSLPVLITLMLRGRSFIGLWMGPQYAVVSGTVLLILASAMLFSLTNNTASAIAFGVEKHKVTARWAIGEGIANLALSITLVHWMGLYGVAIGTVIPSLIINVGLWPAFISKMLGIGRTEILLHVWGPMMLAAVPFALATYLVNRYYPAAHLITFFLQTLALLPFFAAATAVVFRLHVREYVLPRLRAMFVSSVA